MGGDEEEAIARISQIAKINKKRNALLLLDNCVAPIIVSRNNICVFDALGGPLCYRGDNVDINTAGVGLRR